jgi:hypothetical protein
MAPSTENDRADARTEAPETPTRNPGLKALEKLVGRWKASGGLTGHLSYEWMDGGFFLIARGESEQGGRRTRHVEIIGYDHELGAEPSRVMTSRLYTDRGETLSYTH